jgi:type III restriction enzyme
LVVVDGIKYQRLGDEHYYAQELFQQEELTGYLKNMLTATKKSVYEEAVYQSAKVVRRGRARWDGFAPQAVSKQKCGAGRR